MYVCAMYSCSQQLQIEVILLIFFFSSPETDVCNALTIPCKARRYTDTHDEVTRTLGKHQVHPDTGGNSRQVLKKSPVTPTVLLGQMS